MKYRNIRHFSSSLPSLQSRTVSHCREPEIHLRSSRHWNSPSAHSKTTNTKHTIGNGCFSKTYTCFKQALKFPANKPPINSKTSIFIKSSWRQELSNHILSIIYSPKTKNAIITNDISTESGI